MMIREVFIDNKQIDIENNNAAGYIFTSPIFRDITKILSNRTTTYKIPKTSLNLSVFELSDNPDVLADFPYKEHSFSEYRNGLLFISGVCTLLKISDNELELSVIWGNTINLLKLKDLKLRNLGSSKYLFWNEESAFLPNTSTEQEGFIAVDFGRGINDFKYIHPSITMQGILNLITESTGVNFTYPERFNEIFTKKWIPLLEKNADDLTWEDYTIYPEFAGYDGSFKDILPLLLKTDDNKKNIIQRGVIKWSGENYSVNINAKIVFRNLSPIFENGKQLDVVLSFRTMYFREIIGSHDTLWVLEKFASQRVSVSDDGKYHFDLSGLYTNNEGSVEIVPVLHAIDSNGSYRKITNLEYDQFDIKVVIQQDEVRFGDKYPIVSNLPDLSVVDYLKTIMQMYGLYTYYDYKLDNDTIQFISIDDVYLYKNLAYDWTDKLVTSNKGRFNLSFVYGDYAQKNNFKYTKDDTVLTDADSFLLIENETITKEKDLIDISFSPSDNITENNEYVNTTAKIELYDADGKTKSVKNRILTERLYSYKDDNNEPIEKISAYFDESLKFSGEEGLLKEYYSAFQHILRRPVVVECYVYLSDYELHTYREVYPIYIDGTFYMPIEITVQTDSLAVCKLIKMPYKEDK